MGTCHPYYQIAWPSSLDEEYPLSTHLHISPLSWESPREANSLFWAQSPQAPGFTCFGLLISLAAFRDMGNAQDPAICHLAESPFLYPRVLKYPAVACPIHGKISLWNLGKIWKGQTLLVSMPRRNSQARLEPTTCPGPPCLLTWALYILYFITGGPGRRLHLSVYPGNRGQHFLGCVSRGKSCFRALFSLRCQFSPPKPVPGSKQSLLLGVKILFLTPCLASLEDTVAHFIHEVLFS